MHLGEVLRGLPWLLSSQELEVKFIDVISLLNGNMKHARAIEFEEASIVAMLCFYYELTVLKFQLYSYSSYSHILCM